MKYRLSTLILLVTVTAALSGWAKTRVDSRNALDQAEMEFDRNTTAVRTFGGVNQLIETASLIADSDLSVEADHGLKHQLVFAMWQLWYYERRINLMYEGDGYPTQFGRRILDLLDCPDAGSFMEMSRELLVSAQDWPEFHDPKTKEHQELLDFVRRSARTKLGG